VPIAATTAVEISGPTPGTLISRRQLSSGSIKTVRPRYDRASPNVLAATEAAFISMEKPGSFGGI